MRKPGAACFSDFTVAQTLALQVSGPSVMSTTSRPVGGVCFAASTSAAATGFVAFGLKPAPNKSLPGDFALSPPGFAHMLIEPSSKMIVGASACCAWGDC